MARVTYSPLLFSFLLMGLGATLFCSTGRDDAHITYWSSYSLCKLHSFVNYNGDNLEQSSSLFHVALLAFLHSLTRINIVTLGGIISIASGVFATIFSNKLTVGTGSGYSHHSRVMLIGSSPFFLYWSFGGLETSLVTFVSLLFIFATYRSLQKDSITIRVQFVIVLCLYEFTRPEAFLLVFGVIGTISIIEMFFSGRPENISTVQRLGKLLIISLLVTVCMFGIRFFLFGSFFPQPVVAKMGGDVFYQITQGLKYISWNALSVYFFPLLFLFIATAVLHVRQKLFVNTFQLLLYTFIVVQTLFVILAGGDWMEGGRFIVPLIPCMVVLIVDALSRLKYRRMMVLSVTCVFFFQIYGAFHLAMHDSTGRPLWSYVSNNHRINELGGIDQYSFFEKSNRIHLRDLPTISALDSIVAELSSVRRGKISVMSIQAGMVMYHLAVKHYGEVRFTDLWGLSTDDFTKCVVTKDLPRNSRGIELNYSYFFNHYEVLCEKCMVMLPDIIFDLDTDEFARVKLLIQHGYDVVYKQYGTMESHSLLQGGTVSANQFIVVRKELIPFLHFTPREYKLVI